MFKRFWWVFFAMAAVGAVAGFLASAVVVHIMPKKYESEATIEVRPRTVVWTSDANVLSGTPSSKKETPMTPQFFGSEFEKIKTSNSLGKVVDNLELVNRWGVSRVTAIRILKGIVNTQNIRGTDLISIKVRHTNQEDARDIAAEVGRTYKEYRKEIERRDQEQRLGKLQQQINDQEDKVEEMRKVVATILRERGKVKADRIEWIESDGSDTNEESAEAEIRGDAVKRSEGIPLEYEDAKREFETDQALLQSLKLKLTHQVMTSQLAEGNVVIHEGPQIASSPISPNVPLVLMLGTVGGFLFSLLLALPLIWFLSGRGAVW